MGVEAMYLYIISLGNLAVDIKNDCPLDDNYQTRNIMYKCIPSTIFNPDKVYLGTAKVNFRNNTIITRHRSSTWKCECHHPLEISMGSRGQIQRNDVLKVANRKVCPRRLKHYQKVLTMSSSKTWNHHLSYSGRIVKQTVRINFKMLPY